MSDRTTRLDEVADFIRGLIFDKGKQLSAPSDDSIPVLRAGNIGNKLDTQNDLIYVPEAIVSPAQHLQVNDIAICLSSGSPAIVGKTAQLNKPWRGTIGGFCGIIRPKDIAPDFLALWLRSPSFTVWRDEQARGANIQNLRFSELGLLAISLPNRVKQHSIACHLNLQLAEVETARQAAEAQLRDITLLRSRTLQTIFAELDTTPRKTLGDHATTMSGSTPSRSNKAYWQPAEIPWVKTGEVAFAPITATEEAISTKALAECSLALLPPRTILVAMYGQGKTRGQSAMLEIAAATNQACFAILPNDTWEPAFLHYWFMASYQDLRDLSEDRGGNQANLNGALLKALQAPAPDKAAQQDIVQRVKAALATIDAMEQACKASLKDIEQLPQRILAQAFEQVAA
jgi:type I restriction enzyme S subunit